MMMIFLFFNNDDDGVGDDNDRIYIYIGNSTDCVENMACPLMNKSPLIIKITLGERK